MAWQASSLPSSPVLEAATPAGGGGPLRGVRGVRIWWALFLLLLPLYLGQSGYPQVSHLYLVATLPVVLLRWRQQIRLPRGLLVAGLALVTYVTCVNSFWFSLYFDFPSLPLSAFYFAFNFLIVIVIVTMFELDPWGLARVSRMVFFVGLVFETCFVLAVGDRGYGRALGTFNDPNQMGYWALLTATCMFTLRERRTFGPLELLSLALAGFIIFTSVSRAALLGYGVLLVIALTTSQISPRLVLGTLLLACAAVAVAQALNMGLHEPYHQVFDFMERRFASTDTANDSLADRAYARLWLFPEHLILGAGDGAYNLRFGFENETHSTIGAILFSYGIVGFTLFGLLLFLLLRRADRWQLALLVPIVVYGIAQQGVRFSLFWMLLAFVYARSSAREPVDVDVRFPAAY